MIKTKTFRALQIDFYAPLWAGLLVLVLFFLLGSGLSRARPPDPDFESGAEKLNLDNEQVQALQELLTRFRQELMQVRKKMAAKRLELRTLSDEEMQGARGEEIRKELQGLYLSVRDRALVYQAEALKILRADQKEKLPAGSDLGFRCHWGPFRGGGPGRDSRRNPSAPPPGNPPSQP